MIDVVRLGEYVALLAEPHPMGPDPGPIVPILPIVDARGMSSHIGIHIPRGATTRDAFVDGRIRPILPCMSTRVGAASPHTTLRRPA